MKPLIKWTGGKRSEIKHFKEFYPAEFDNFVEPFLGGGAVFFDLDHEKNYVNDFNAELVGFYSSLKNDVSRQAFVDRLKDYNNERVLIKQVITSLDDARVFEIIAGEFKEKVTANKIELVKEKIDGRNKTVSKDILDNGVNVKVDIDVYTQVELGDVSFTDTIGLNSNIINEREILINLITAGLKDKSKRIIKINNDRQLQGQVIFSVDELKEHMETSVQSALYNYARKIYNHAIEADEVLASASWYLVRELCYSGMFRFDSNGNFNVPYGGIGYNKKDFVTKINIFNNDEVVDLLHNSVISNLDFEEFFKVNNYFGENDFIFLDPPYDSEFSQYNKEEDFTKDDQVRLRDTLLKTKARVMVVIKHTDFIYDLYKDDFSIMSFDKTYSVNFRGRNDRGVTHIIITNYDVND